MNLLIITQKVDRQDAVLGFFHRWLAEFAKTFELVTVICLQKGPSDLPANVKVLSLGKEKKESRLSYVIHFYKYIWQERKNYDAVFVHMNQEYVLLGWLFWKLTGKKILLWRNHKMGSVLTRFAVLVSDTVYCTSPHSFTARFKKTELMPAGIDIEFFKKDTRQDKKQNSLLFFGRISPVKRVEDFIEACRLLKERNVKFSADIVGDPPAADRAYYKTLKETARKAGLAGLLTFKPGIPNTEAPALYSQYEVYINTTPAGSFDKTILEALSCETLVVTSNESFSGFLPDKCIFKQGHAAGLADVLAGILDWSPSDKANEAAAGRMRVKEIHGLELLVKKVEAAIS